MEHASTDNESKDMDIEAELLVSDQSHEEHIIIAQQGNFNLILKIIII